MAQGLPSGILDTVLKQLRSPIFQSNKLNCLVHIQLRDLRSKLELIREVIDDAEGMGVLFPDVVGKWVCELQCVLYEVDDLLDEVLTRSMPAAGVVEKVGIQYCNLPFFGLTVAHKMKKMNKRLGRIVEKCHECNLFVVEPPDHPQSTTTSSSNYCYRGGGNRRPIARKGILRYDPDYVKDDDELRMIGRDDARKNVIEMLRNEDPNGYLVWVTGSAGVGKSTLCRSVFKDAEVRSIFGIRSWVSFRDVNDFTRVGLWKKIATALCADDEEAHPNLPETEDRLWDMIVSKFHGNKKILLVFDNILCPVFSSDCDEAESLVRLRDLIGTTSHKGSKILIALSDRVLFHLLLIRFGNYFVCELRNDLSEDHSWSIFEMASLVSEHDGQMIDLGKQIVSRCTRNPALLKCVGTVLCGNKDKDMWEHFAYGFDFSGQYDRYSKISRLATNLPKCQYQVGYLSLFSEGEVKQMSLTHQFEAHGFTKVSSEVQQLFHDLMLDISSKDSWDGIDNLRADPDTEATIMLTAGEESTAMKCTEGGLPEATRHVSIVRPSSPPTGQQQQQPYKRILSDSLINDITHRRTLLFLGELSPIRMSVQTLDKLVSNLRYLRVLDLHDLALQTLPSSVGMLIHLRYLDLSRNDFRMLPVSICNLKNLMTLKLVYCDKLVKLPQRIETLRRLKNLEINMCLDLTHMPSTMGRLTCLERLDQLVVSPHKGGLRYLEYLDNLYGELAIDLPRRWRNSRMEADQAKLERKKGLTTLRFKWPNMDNGGDTEDGDDNDHVLDKLKPCTDIEHLSIVSFGGTKFPRWIVDSSSLSEIIISNCKRCQTLPLFHRMPKLQHLTLTSMNVEYLQDYNDGDEASCVVSTDASVFFPSLVELKIGEMPDLKRWSKDLGGLPKFPNVESLIIWSCPRLSMMPRFSEIRYVMTLQAVPEEMIQLLEGRCYYAVSIISISNMVCLPDQFVYKLPKKLIIKDCNQMRMLWGNEVGGTEADESMVKLAHLRIINCPALKHVSSNLRQLKYLEKLKIYNCGEELDCLYEDDDSKMPWKALRRLQRLEIKGFHNLVALPKDLRHLPKLGRLDIMDCKALKWEVRRLPPTLRELRIGSCPLLYERAEEIRREHPYLTLLD